MNNLAILIGPTASGKTALAIAIAKALNCEVISGDSMQFYRHMDIGTAKVTPWEQEGIPHHLIDIRNPDESYTVADFQKDCYRLVEEINQRGKLPLLVGGTALYVKAIIDGYTFSRETPGNDGFRRAKAEEAVGQAPGYLYRQLLAVDPAAAARISPEDNKRIIRALEVYEKSGVPLSAQAGKNPPPYRMVLLGIRMDRAELYRKIDQRVEEMMVNGLENEVKNLLAMGYGRNLKPMQGLGYRQMTAYLTGELSLKDAVDLIKRDTRHFAKRQLTWWRREERVHWLDAASPNIKEEAASYIRQQLPEI